VQIPDDLPVMTKPFASAELAARVSQLLEATA
jgi:DNA-binding response OmpR family regulator